MTWAAPDPTPDGARRGPVVALLDTGIGEHPWFREGVIRDPEVGGEPIGLRFPPAEDPEGTGCTIDTVNGVLDRLAGHGTFIAGVVRQHCPQATLMAVPVMYGDGIADEATVVDALQLLFARQLVALRDPEQGPLVDVLSLSLGYYHETSGAFDDEGALVSALRGLASTGVAIVAAAGNGASDVEFFPGAFSQSSSFDVPLVCVGAHNPGGHQPHLVPPGTPTVSVYSNTGGWVTAYRCGTAVVSTMPVTFDGSIRSVLFQPGSPNPTRGSIDLDDYSGGFGQWSGTSFAAPALAGDIAKRLLGTDGTGAETQDAERVRSRALPERARGEKAAAGSGGGIVERRVRRAAEAVELAVKEGS